MEFNLKSVRDDIIKTFGPAGAHIEVFDHFLQKALAHARHTRDCEYIKSYPAGGPLTRECTCNLAGFLSEIDNALGGK